MKAFRVAALSLLLTGPAYAQMQTRRDELARHREESSKIIPQPGIVPDKLFLSPSQRIGAPHPPRHPFECPADPRHLPVRREEILEQDRHQSLQSLRQTGAMHLHDQPGPCQPGGQRFVRPGSPLPGKKMVVKQAHQHPAIEAIAGASRCRLWRNSG